jgi:peptide/nickel transport system ATP-binding protein
MTTPVLEISDLSIALPPGADRPLAVDCASLAVAPGELVCLVGESGSGKSVIAQSVMGLLPEALPVVGGEIRLQGEDVARASRERLRELRATRMAMIFQEPMTALNPVMRCGDQIEEVLAQHTRLDARGRRARVLEAIREVQLTDTSRIADAFPHQLSGGQRQRVMIAMGLVLGPSLLIADEPTTALDATTQAQILRLIRELQGRHGTGVLFITHDFGVVAEIADRVAVLSRGQLVEQGTKADVLRRPQHPYTKRLIAAVPGLVPRAREMDLGAPVVLETRRLSKVYVASGLLRRQPAVKAIEDVSLQIRRGQTLGLVGESGSGKSTVARCIVRLVDPTGGEIVLDGEDIARKPPRALGPMRRRVQIVFQDPYRSLNPRRRVGESVIEGPRNYGVPHGEALERARRLFEWVELDPASLHRYPHELSGGQRQRVCIARALAMEPELLVADEAVSALDVSVQAQVLRLLAGIRERLDLAMLFITHDLRVAAQVCDTVAVMAKGRVVELGPATRVFTRPEHGYTRALLAAAPGRGWRFAA